VHHPKEGEGAEEAEDDKEEDEEGGGRRRGEEWEEGKGSPGNMSSAIPS